MSKFTRDIIASAETSSRGLTTGSVTDPARMSWREVHGHAKRTAGGLAAHGIGPHSSVAVLAADAADVAPLAQAIWLRGAALTMLQHPIPRADLALWFEDTVRAVRLINADVVVFGEPFSMAIDQLVGSGLAVCSVESLRKSEPIEFAGTEPDETVIAMRQLTSGSTGVPKAVEISHGNLAAHAVAARDGVQLRAATDVMVSWLPLSHDMGMVGFLCLTAQLGVEAVIVTPDQFLRRPLSWAELISKHRGTITSGPNFGYSVLARHLQRADPTEIDLSCLRVAVNGAEPIDHRGIAEFVAAGEPFGLRPSAPMPGYGMAEATLTVSLGAVSEEATIDTVSRQGMMVAHRALPVGADSADAEHIVCVGHPVTGMAVRIVQDGKGLAPRKIGAIQLRGPAIAGSYRTDHGVSALTDADGWFDTGDLGYLDEQGRIYVCGRTKDIIVLAGKNLYPHDIERVAEGVDGVRKGCVIALRVDVHPEGFAVLAEVHGATDDEHRRIRRDITARVTHQVGHAPHEVQLLPAGTLPKTPSGKLRRGQARDLLGRQSRDATLATG